MDGKSDGSKYAHTSAVDGNASASFVEKRVSCPVWQPCPAKGTAQLSLPYRAWPAGRFVLDSSWYVEDLHPVGTVLNRPGSTRINSRVPACRLVTKGPQRMVIDLPRIEANVCYGLLTAGRGRAKADAGRTATFEQRKPDRTAGYRPRADVQRSGTRSLQLDNSYRAATPTAAPDPDSLKRSRR
jgi:hypothetical protein